MTHDRDQHGYVYAAEKRYCHPVTSVPGTCQDHRIDPNKFEHSTPCTNPARIFTVNIRELGRGKVERGYCDEHMGADRAMREIESSFLVLAPPEVGDREAVIAAGEMALGSRATFITLRPTPGGKAWLAWLGVGSLIVPVVNPRGGLIDRRGDKDLRSKGTGCAPTWRGAHNFPTKEEAREEAERCWKRYVANRVAEIRWARGGTLAWGYSVDPPRSPIVLCPEPGESGWDCLPDAERSE